jgi:hypothetical protein
MNRRQRKEQLKKMGMGSHNVSAMLPTTNPSIIREYKIGRNDPCPCGATHNVKGNKTIELPLNNMSMRMDFWNVPNKYKNCCMRSGKYENYK